ncbi:MULTISPECIES: DJ-1/PfpI family protein [Streptomyces]|uniref:DJ-1/PfpI family protein n=1 Tax=Streptomyces lichenis TaxID=2306967 RepID=A0ABT0I9P3_9ACTN|nr:DJ-1/PfpI family protein [Streptomyces lichenis]MCK8678052.1 DJ-1/PfpI family protein [Streptomyces lichenis]
MQIAILLHPGLTALDAVGPAELLQRMPGNETVFVAREAGPVRNDQDNLSLVAGRSLAEVTRPDVVLVPGGPDVRATADDPVVQDWLRAVDRTTTWTTSVCTGSLVLGAAGLLTGRRATTHWLARDRLAGYGAEPTGERVVFDGKYVTAAGVSSGIDMALHLLGRLGGDDMARIVQLMTEYDPQPPYDAGSPDKAPAHLVDFCRTELATHVDPAG